jgi:uncharacterized protein YkwD
MARVALALVMLLALGGPASARVSEQPLAGHPPVSGTRHAVRMEGISALSDLEQQLVVAVNHQRVRRGLVPLRISRQLSVAARGHSLSMAEHGYFAHESYDGSAFWVRIKAVYPALRGRIWAAGENLAWASPELTAAEAVDMWLKSPQHRKNLLAPRWREVGIGGVRALAASGVYEGLDATIVTADFGVR